MIEPQVPAWEPWLQRWWAWFLIPGILVNAGALIIPILEPDGALYATLAKTIAQSGDYINLRVGGKDWLDKPHFPFWLAALSMRAFGINQFAYKLPALLFWGAGAWYTYRLATAIYGRVVGQLSVLIYVSAAHLVISNNDVRAEPYLTGLVIGAVFHFYRASRLKTGWHLVAGSLLAACAMMTKGPFVLITIAAGFVIDWTCGRQWGQFLQIRWLVAILLIGIFITPELYCLYLQFDRHPEKLIFGRTGVSGIRFFFWESQFGRFFNTGPIRGNGDPFFYLHTLLWAFLPWSLLLYAAVVKKCRSLRSRHITGDLICLGGALVSFVIFSLSKFQLPHYLNLLFPFFSILTASWLVGIRRRKTKWIIGLVQQCITSFLPQLILLLSLFFRFGGWPLIMTGAVVLAFIFFRIFRGRELTNSVARSYWIALLTYTFINFIFYPAMLDYQAGTKAGGFVGGTGDTAVYMLSEAPRNYSFEFSSPLPVRQISADSLHVLTWNGPVLMFLPAINADSLPGKGYRVEVLKRLPNFHISQLTAGFIDYRTRAQYVDWVEVVRIF